MIMSIKDWVFINRNKRLGAVLLSFYSMSNSHFWRRHCDWNVKQQYKIKVLFFWYNLCQSVKLINWFTPAFIHIHIIFGNNNKKRRKQVCYHCNVHEEGNVFVVCLCRSSVVCVLLRIYREYFANVLYSSSNHDMIQTVWFNQTGIVWKVMISHEPPKIISNKERIHLSYSMRLICVKLINWFTPAFIHIHIIFGNNNKKRRKQVCYHCNVGIMSKLFFKWSIKNIITLFCWVTSCLIE
jgi:hypothetical protein